MIPGAAVIFPGLKKRTGSWAICHGVWCPVILIDPLCPQGQGYNALVAHEAFHARMRHKAKEIFLLTFAWTGVFFILWALFRRRIERTADQEALRVFGDREFRAFLALHKAPSSWWGRFKYGATLEARYKRATGRDWSDGEPERGGEGRERGEP